MLLSHYKETVVHNPIYYRKRDFLKTRVEEMTKLSTVPSILKKIMEITEDANSTLEDLERIIEHDPPIASKVVGVSNAAFYGFPRKITTVSQAIIVLGFEMVKGIAISTAVFSGLTDEQHESMTKVWQHSFETAMAAGMIADKTGAIGKETAFLGGLLHDIGIPILFQIFGEDYLKLAKNEENSLTALERDAFGADHAESGAWFAEKCKLPELCVSAIKYHHTPENIIERSKNDQPLVLSEIVYLANLLTDNFHNNDYALISPVHSKVLKNLNINGQRLSDISNRISLVREDIKKFFL